MSESGSGGEQPPESLPKLVRGEEVETAEGDEVVAQQTVGVEEADGGGEWPDPQAPPRYPAPGAAEAEDDATGG